MRGDVRRIRIEGVLRSLRIYYLWERKSSHRGYISTGLSSGATNPFLKKEERGGSGLLSPYNLKNRQRERWGGVSRGRERGGSGSTGSILLQMGKDADLACPKKQIIHFYNKKTHVDRSRGSRFGMCETENTIDGSIRPGK